MTIFTQTQKLKIVKKHRGSKQTTAKIGGLVHNPIVETVAQPIPTSRETLQIQLGGYINGNPHLIQSGSATTILNEVNSSDRSVLKGYIGDEGNAQSWCDRSINYLMDRK